jgi:hypothetical protein
LSIATAPVRREILRLVTAWLYLLALAGIEFAASLLPMPHVWRPLLLAPSALMAIIVGVSFMDVKKGPPIVRAFAVGALFWLVILLALGSADPLTRKDDPVPKAGPELSLRGRPGV